MKPQDFRIQDQEIIRRFLEARQAQAGEPQRLKLSLSNWGFGSELLEDSAARLQRNGIEWIELHGNLYGPDLGYRAANVTAVLDAHGIAVSGICGMVTPEQELASNRPHVRQRFVDYLRRQLEFCTAVGGRYILFGAAAVGRPLAYDDHELARAAETLAVVADDFAAAGVLAAVEPIRPEETSIVHPCAEAAALIERVGHPGVQHIAGDLYHMLSGEGHVGRGVLEWAPRMANLHLADSNRRALGTGVLDLDIVIMALYVAGFNEGMRFCTAEPLGAGGDPYLQMFGPPTPRSSTRWWRRRPRRGGPARRRCSWRPTTSCSASPEHFRRDDGPPPRIVVVGPSPAMDRMEILQRFDLDRVNHATEVRARPGGKSLIVARTLRGSAPR